MSHTVLPIRQLLAVFAAALLSAGCATSGQVHSTRLANASPCPERTVLVCEEHSSLHSSCSCTTRDHFHLMTGQR